MKISRGTNDYPRRMFLILTRCRINRYKEIKIARGRKFQEIRRRPQNTAVVVVAKDGGNSSAGGGGGATGGGSGGDSSGGGATLWKHRRASHAVLSSPREQDRGTEREESSWRSSRKTFEVIRDIGNFGVTKMNRNKSSKSRKKKIRVEEPRHSDQSKE
ncbi:hypothetical protein V1478_000595 [Vespula squamosa]|uniref:Uncharacterized protein n=1 Tax=Vespula squamosa TaxID=30214 RepID=A0ABD2C5Y0_VESSQ